jgi:hypothetical protein
MCQARAAISALKFLCLPFAPVLSPLRAILPALSNVEGPALSNVEGCMVKFDRLTDKDRSSIG